MTLMAPLSALPYYGGKNALGQVGPWIAGLLPWNRRQLYVEPFAGMLGVLLCRPPCVVEIANDLDGHVVNWWLQLRDNTDELIHRTWNTPRSRRVFADSKALLLNGDAAASDMDRAVAFHCALIQGVTLDGGWAVSYTPEVGKVKRRTPKMMQALADRLRLVQLENRPAEDILDRCKGMEHAVVYCDPPYASADTTPYLERGECDQAALGGLLRAQRGVAALSGYASDGWDDLLPGWRRFDKVVPFRGLGENVATERKNGNRRVESLWVNKVATGTRPLF